MYQAVIRLCSECLPGGGKNYSYATTFRLAIHNTSIQADIIAVRCAYCSNHWVITFCTHRCDNMSFVWHSASSFQDKLQSMIIPRYLQLSTLDIFLPLTFNWKSGWFFLSLLKTQKHVLSTLRLSLLAINHLGICCKQVLALSNRVQRFFSYKNNCNKGTWQTDGYTTTAIPIALAYRLAVKKILQPPRGRRHDQYQNATDILLAITRSRRWSGVRRIANPAGEQKIEPTTAININIIFAPCCVITRDFRLTTTMRAMKNSYETMKPFAIFLVLFALAHRRRKRQLKTLRYQVLMSFS